MLLRLLLINVVIIHFVVCLPSVIIKTGAKNNEEQQQHQNAGNHNVVFKVGTTGLNAEDGFNKGSENKHAQAQDAGKYSQENGDKKQHVDKSNFADQKFHQESGGAVADFGSQLDHKKGHHKSGFHNSYHKDESGSNSSYYDDSDNQGGEYVHNSRKGNFGGASSHNNEGSRLDGKYSSKEDAKHGGYDKGGSYNRDVGDNRNYNQENYYDNRESLGKNNAGNQHGSSGGFVEEKYHQQHPQYYEPPHYYEQPHYYQKPQYYERPYYERSDYVRDYYEPLPYSSYNYPEQKTITIYEDPRVFEQTTEHKRYEKYPQYKADYDANLVQLDVRPPISPNVPEYYETGKPVYEEYYY